MKHDPSVCLEDAIRACELILQFVQGMTEENFSADLKTKAAVDRQFEIIGEALNKTIAGCWMIAEHQHRAGNVK